MKPWDYQDELSDLGLAILRKHFLLYLSMEERTGKSLTAILVAEKSLACNVLIVTKKGKPLQGWVDTLAAYKHLNLYEVVNYHSVDKAGDPDYDLIILDEAHNYISSYPKPNTIWKKVRRYTKNKPIIYLSATPHAQGYQMLYNQFALSSWSPWRRFKDFYAWFKEYGKPYTLEINSIEVNQYDQTKEDKILADVSKYFISKTRKELGFEHEPRDKLHYIELTDKTKALYNKIVKDAILYLPEGPLVCDTKSKMRYALHQLEGGTCKIDDEYHVFDNTEKIEYIKKAWGDTEDLVIMYNYKPELDKLSAAFKKAKLLQATTNAEGIDLYQHKHLVIYSQDFSTARHTQRRARQANKERDEPITVHFLLVKGAISEDVYQTVSVNKKNFVDSVFKRRKL